MGSCFSSVPNNYESATTAKVISVHGELREYSIPITVDEVLQRETFSSTLILCNSDSLYYDESIPALDQEYELQPGQIYFVLPKTKLEHRLSASDMAALAVKASVAIQNGGSGSGSDNRRRSKKKGRISPVLDVKVRASSDISQINNGSIKKKPAISRSGSLKKFQRYSSRRAMTAVRSFRLRLSTIYEDGSARF